MYAYDTHALVHVEISPRLLQVDEQSAVDEELGARHVAAQVAAEEHGWPRQVGWHACPAQRYPAFHVLPLLVVVEVLVVELRLDCAGQDGVASDVVFAQRAG